MPCRRARLLLPLLVHAPPCRVADVGLGRYVLYFALYMTSVEFCVYWQHRILHMGIGYRWAHGQQRGMAWHDMAWRGMAWHATARCRIACHAPA